MITGREAFTITKRHENRNSYYKTEMESISDTINCACEAGKYEVEFDASIYSDGDEEEIEAVMANLMDKIAQNLKGQGFEVIYNSGTGTFSIRWDGKKWN